MIRVPWALVVVLSAMLTGCRDPTTKPALPKPTMPVGVLDRTPDDLFRVAVRSKAEGEPNGAIQRFISTYEATDFRIKGEPLPPDAAGRYVELASAIMKSGPIRAESVDRDGIAFGGSKLEWLALADLGERMCDVANMKASNGEMEAAMELIGAAAWIAHDIVSFDRTIPMVFFVREVICDHVAQSLLLWGPKERYPKEPLLALRAQIERESISVRPTLRTMDGK